KGMKKSRVIEFSAAWRPLSITFRANSRARNKAQQNRKSLHRTRWILKSRNSSPGFPQAFATQVRGGERGWDWNRNSGGEGGICRWQEAKTAAVQIDSLLTRVSGDGATYAGGYTGYPAPAGKPLLPN